MTSRTDLKDMLRQMIATMEEERQALAGMDIDAIMGCAQNKADLCDNISAASNDNLDDECLSLIDAAKRMNEVNRQVRNLVASNVATRLAALTGGANLYKPNPAKAGYARHTAAPIG